MADYCIMEPEGDVLTCKGCSRKLKRWVGLPENVVRTCKGVTGRKSVVTSWKQHRERTPEEYAAVTATCYACEHYQPDLGICGLKAKGGCGACKDGASFAKFKLSGLPCPDKPRRFEGTELVEPAP